MSTPTSTCPSRDRLRLSSVPQIYEHFVPLASHRMAAGTALVKQAAAEALVMFLRHNRKQSQRTDIYVRLIRDFARGRSFTRRMLFIDMCRCVMRRFSTR